MEDTLISMLNDICGNDLFNSIFETLSINLFSGGEYSSVLRIVKSLHNSVIMPLALMLMFIYFMIAVVDKLSQENFQWDQLFRTLAMLLASKYLIEHGFDILKLLFDIGMALAAQIQAWTGFTGEEPQELANAKEILDNFRTSLGWKGIFGGSFFSDLLLWLYLLLPWLGHLIMKLCISVICYTRVVEIYFRATFAPIALADFFHSGLQGTGWRFLKSFLAVCLQGGAILVIAVIFSSLTAQHIGSYTEESDFWSFIGVYLAFAASAVMLMFKSLSLTKEIVGVN